MNLEDLIDDKGLQQDEWSLTRPMFGEEDQLKVVGWSGRQQSSKLYILRCTTCSQDKELFGEGFFRSKKGNLVILNQSPCGCTRSPRWTKEQYFVLCSRKAEQLGYTFLGFAEDEWRGSKTRVRVICERHGEWNTGVIRSFVNLNAGCPKCGSDKAVEGIIKANTKPDDVMITSFLASGAFHPDTKFWRSDRLNSDGYKCHWHLFCPECEGSAEASSGNLQKGHRSCDCSSNQKHEAYIHLLFESHAENCKAIKFGISCDSSQRVRRQDRMSIYKVKQHSVYRFQDTSSCKKSERDCKQELECGILTKEEAPDGYTETTWAYNLDKIIEIYERNGGIKT